MILIYTYINQPFKVSRSPITAQDGEQLLNHIHKIHVTSICYDASEAKQVTFTYILAYLST